MQHYYISKEARPDGHHEVHVPRCIHLPDPNDRIYLGAFTSSADAVREARSRYTDARGCNWCCGGQSGAQG